MKSIFAVLAVLTLTAGCATFQNTPQQDRTWAAYDSCKAQGRVTHVQITRVEPNGRYWYSASDTLYGGSALVACMEEEFAKRRATR